MSFALTPTWSLACKQTNCITEVCGNCLTVNTKHLYDFMQCWTSVKDVGPTLYKCHANVLCLLRRRTFSNIVHLSIVGSIMGQRRRRWPNINTALNQCLV